MCDVLQMADEKTTAALDTEHQHGPARYEPIDVDRLLAFAGVRSYREIAPMMTHQFAIEFASQEGARRGEERLRAMCVDGRPALSIACTDRWIAASCAIATVVDPATQVECDGDHHWSRENFFSIFRLVACGLLCWLFALASPAAAATRTWTGAGPDTSTATAANWAGNTPPQDGDDVVFPAGAAQMTVAQDLSVQFHSITFATTGGQVYHVTGDITIIDRIEVDSGEADLTGSPLTMVQSGMIPADITLAAAAGTELVINKSIAGSPLATLHIVGPGRVSLGAGNSYSGSTQVESGTLRLTNDFALGGNTAAIVVISTGATLELDGGINAGYDHALQFNDGSTLLATTGGTITNNTTVTGSTTVNVPATKTLRIGSRVVGTGTFTKIGAGDVLFFSTVDNTFGANLGPMIVNAGNVFLSQSFGGTTHVALPFGVVINNGAQVFYQMDNQIGGNVTVNAGGSLRLQNQTDAIQALDGQVGAVVDLGSNSALTVGIGQFAGAITGVGTLNVTGGSLLQLSGTSSFTGNTIVANQGLLVTGTLPGPIFVQGGTLNGTGTVGNVSCILLGAVAPGKQGGGTLHTKSLTLTGGTYVVKAFQLPGGPVWSSTAVTGTVTLGAAAGLDHAGFDPAITVVPATPIVIIDNDGSDPVVGMFNGLPEGAAFLQNGVTYHISYHGGDGNDVVLIASPQTGPQPRTYYLSEGSTGGFFTTDVLIANPNTTDAPATLTFYTEAHGVVTKDITVPALQRVTVTLNTVPEIGDGAVSTLVTSTSGAPLVVERTMTWDKTGYGASGDKAVDAPAMTWYFAEGSQGYFWTYVLLANPQTTANSATVTFFREGDTPITRTYDLAPQSRTTLDLSADEALINRSFGFQVQFAQPAVAERAMYFGKNPLWTGGHESAGVTAPAADWLLAEGATGPFFETFILLANPNATDAQATLTFLPAGGAPVVETKTIPANGRLTINIEQEDHALANVAVATQVHADVPVVAERSQYWPDPAPEWYEAHNSFGITTPGTKWGFAEGRVGQTPAYQTFILFANPGQTPANVTVQFLREHGGAPFTKTFVVPATSRLNVWANGPGSDVPELVDENFAAVITADQPIAVERSMYANANGQVWAAGTNATGSPLP